MEGALTPPIPPFVDALPVPRRLVAAEHHGRFTVRIRAGTHRFHRDLAPSPIWGYDGTVPGPTIETERGQHVTIDWLNEIDAPMPVAVTIAPAHAGADGVPVQCVPGMSGGTANPDAAALAGYTVVHLHGGMTPASYDGWAENLFAPGQPAVFHYALNQRAALLWYHDHVMGVTKYGVYAGLAGLWIVRDERERELSLPEGPPYEVPLLLQDRNFDVDAHGHMTGRLLHKTDPDVMEAFAPFTVVNGVIWPVLNVQPATYRFRVINGSNARSFRLVLWRDGSPDLQRITQIGTDHGLMHAPCSLPHGGLTLSSAERADLLVDFSDLAPGTELTLFNTASAPFDGAAFAARDADHAANLDGLLPYPQVMKFRVSEGTPARQTAPSKLANDFTAPSAGELAAAPHRAILLVERELEGEPSMLTMRELESVDDDYAGPAVTVTDGDDTTRYRVVAAHFEDTTTFFPMLEQYEVWRLINLTEDTHPIHVHLDPFQIVGRRPLRFEVPDGAIADRDITASIWLERDPQDALDHTIDDNERGLKDTIRVNPKELVDIAVRFTTYAGRYMYHCHILEHEDRDMMRPFVTMPPELMPFMA